MTKQFVVTKLKSLKIMWVVKKAIKYVAKAAITGAVLAGGAYSVGAQTGYDYTTLPGMDVFSRPDINSTRAYGDGDVNSDGNVDFADAQAIYSGVKNDYADVNGDGIVNSDDGKMIEDFANGERNYLPGDWNALNKLEGSNNEGISKRRAEKVDWLNKIKAIEETDKGAYVTNVWECGNFSRLTAVNMAGFEDFENYGGYHNYMNKNITNGRFNLPVYMVATRTEERTNPDGTKTYVGGHWINGAFVGSENPNEKIIRLTLNNGIFGSLRRMLK